MLSPKDVWNNLPVWAAALVAGTPGEQLRTLMLRLDTGMKLADYYFAFLLAPCSPFLPGTWPYTVVSVSFVIRLLVIRLMEQRVEAPHCVRLCYLFLRT